MKSTFKLTPVSLYDMAGLEGWLEEQANLGLFPAWVTGDLTQFHKEEAVPGTRFRLEAMGKLTKPDPEQVEFYQASGWEYGGTISSLYFLYYAVSRSAPELHTDPVTQSYALEALVKKVKGIKRSNHLFRALALALIAFTVVMGFDNIVPRFALLLLHFTGPLLLGILILCWNNHSAAKNMNDLLKLHRALEKGIPLEPIRPTPRQYRRNRISYLCSIPLLILLLIPYPFRKPIPLEEAPLPYVPLAELEEEPMVPFGELYGPSSFHEDENTMALSFSLLSPRFYTAAQDLYSLKDGTMKGSFSPTDKPEHRYVCSLDAAYFQLLIPAMARPVAEAQIHQFSAINVDWTRQELSCPGLDWALLVTGEDGGPYHSLAIAKGGRLAVFHYGGREDLTDHLDKLVPLVTGP